MSELTVSKAKPPALATAWSSDYRAVDKMGVFGGSLQVMLQHFGDTKAVLVPFAEYERLTRLCPKVNAAISQQISAGDIQKRPGDSMLGVKGGSQILGIVRYGQLKAALLPYAVWTELKVTVGEKLPKPPKETSEAVPAKTGKNKVINGR